MKETEDQVQIALLEWLRLVHPEAWALTHHSPNGGARSAVTGARLKNLGVRKGFPDLICLLPRRGFSALAVELKAGRNRPTPEQTWWIERMGAMGWLAVVCTGLDAAQRQFSDYLA